MGSPAHALRLNPRLRPWVSAGVTYFFGKMQHQSVAHHDKVVVPQRSKSSSVSTVGDATTAARPIFPAPWDQYWSKASPGAQVVFTYQDLAIDLSGSGDARRGSVFREILHHLGWMGKGIVSFWPSAALIAGSLQSDHQTFWAGVQSIQANTIVCFGEDAYASIIGRPPKGQGVYSSDGYTLHVLVHPDQLMTMLPHERHLAADSLKSIRLMTEA